MTGGRDLKNIALIGFMGCGKSSVGHAVASLIHFGFIDTDHLVELRAAKSITHIFEQDGEPVFRQHEQAAVHELSSFNKMVIATGGGLGANPEHLASLKMHSLVVCLWASPESIWERVRSQSHRPLLRGPDPQGRIRELLAERGPIYRQADVLISTDLRGVRDVTQQVVHQWRLAKADASHV